MPEFPDWLRGIALVGKSGTSYVPVAVDANGQLYIILTGAPEITIPGNVNVNDLNTLKQIQGSDGANYRTARVDASGQFIMVPRGNSGNYMSVDASGFLTAIMKGQPALGVPLSVAVDGSGQIIMVPRGQSGNYMDVEAHGYMTAVVKGNAPGGLLVTLSTDTAGQLIMVPRGQNGNYMTVDASGFLTTVMKGIYSGNLATIAVDAAGRMVGVLTDPDDVWSGAQQMGLAELASRLGGVQRWDTRGRMFDAIIFDNGIPQDATIQKAGNEIGVIVPHHNLSGGYAFEGTLENVGGSYIALWRYVRSNFASKVGGEIAVATSSTNLEFGVYLGLYNTSHVYQPQLKWNTNTNALTIGQGEAVQVTLATNCKNYATDKIYNHMKLVVDPTTGKWVRALWNERTFDLSAYSMTDYGASADTYVRNICNVRTVVNSAPVFYLDHIATTYAEPA